MQKRRLPGVSAMSAYVPPFRVSLKEWCEWTGNSWEKVRHVVGSSFRVPGPHENVYTMAANAVLRLILRNDIDPQRIGFLALGTESSTCNSAGAVIVRGLVDRGLESLGRPRLSRSCEVPEFKQACLGGVYALKGATRYVACDGPGRLAIAVAADVAEYERGSSGEQTQGAGAVAMLVEAEARLFGLDLTHAGSASDYRGPDFRKPHARHRNAGYASATRRAHDFPVFNGRYSTYAYLDQTVHAVEAMLRRLDVSAGTYYASVGGLFFHRPYALMPVQAMSFLYVRGLARGDSHRDELQDLCRAAGVDVADVDRETSSTPDLYAAVAERGADVADPYLATSAVARELRSRDGFRDLLNRKMSLGGALVGNLGNLYSAALPAWIAAGFETAAASGLDLDARPLVAVGYGSGDAAEAIPLVPAHGWEAPARRIGLASALDGALDLRRDQYEALHDGLNVPGLTYCPRDEFVITHVGEHYAPAFQDLGVEYYRYVAGAC